MILKKLKKRKKSKADSEKLRSNWLTFDIIGMYQPSNTTPNFVNISQVISHSANPLAL